MATSTDRVTADSKPTIKKLQRHVIPHVVTKWNELGFELFDEEHVHMLDAIYTNHSKDVNKCCHEMFRKWLATYDNTTWYQIVEALKSPGIELGLVAAELEKNLIGKDNGSSDHETLDFTEYKDVPLAYTALFSTLLREVKIKGDFVTIQTACEDRADRKLRKQIKKTRDVNSLFKLLAENKSHCNWLDVRFLEVIATASGSIKLVNLIQDYKKNIYSKTLREVWTSIPHHKVRTKYHSKLQVKFDGKNPDDVTVEEFKRTCKPYLVKKIVKLIAVIKENSISITWLIPTDTVYEYYLSTLIMPQELRQDSYLQIGDWVVHHPLHVLQVLQKDYRWILPSTLLIGYYHSLLMRDIDPCVVMDKMCSNGLLAPHDQGTILAGCSVYQRSWLLLENVRHMEIKTLVKFCEFVQEVLPQVGVQLVTALNFDTTMEPEHYAPSLVLKNAPMVYSSPSSLHMLFLGLIDQVNELLQVYDARLVTETCRNLMASEPHRINLFSDSYINNLSDYTNAASLLRCLSFLFTWSDHSILRALVSCSHEAIELLDKFDSFLDPFNTIISYPIDGFSLSMIPFKDSPYTVLAIRCNRELWQCSLQYVFNIRSILVELCEITQHCLQLLATQSDPTIFYWNIPKCVVELVEESLEKHDEYLCSQGIVEVTVYPKQLLFIGDDVIVGSLAFVVKQEINTEDVKKTSTEALLKAGNKKIDYLQSELNKSKQLGEQFRKAAEKATEKYENLLKEYNRLKESSEKDTVTRLENLKDKISDCNLKLENNLKQIFPDCQLDTEPYQEKDPMQQEIYIVEHLQKLVKCSDDIWSEYDKQKQEKLQLQDELQSELKEKTRLIEENEKLKKLKESGEEDTMTKLENLKDKVSDCNLKLGKNLKQIFPDCQLDMEAYQEKDPMEQVIYHIEHLEKLVKDFDNIQSEYDKQKQEKLQLQDELQSELKVKTRLIEENEKLKELIEETMTKLEKLKDQISDRNVKLEKKLKQIFPDCQLDMEAYQDKDPIQQVVYNLDHLEKSVNQFQSEYSKQQQIQLQQSQDLHNLKSVIELKTKEANKNISYLQNELDEIKHMIEQFREAAMKSKESNLDRLQRLVKHFDVIQSEYDKQKQKELQLRDELDSLELKTTKLKEDNKMLLKQLKESKQLGEQFQEAAEKTTEKYENLLKEYNRLKESSEKDTVTKLENLKDKVSDCNLKLEKILKQICPDCQLDMEPYQEKDPIQQVIYNVEHLQELVKRFDNVQFEYDKQKQKELQLQDELYNLESELTVKTTKLKEDNKMLLKKLRESKTTNVVPATSRPDNVDYPVKYGQLGSGLFGEVHRVYYKNNTCAGKIIHKEVLSGYRKTTHMSMSELQTQLEIKCKSLAGNLYHPNVEQFFEVVLSSADDGIPMILTELLNESLTVFVERCKETIHVNQEIDLCNNMAQGLVCLHSSSLVHGNLHGNNVLISRDGRAKIADYLCPLLFSNIDVYNSSDYLPPEVFQNKTTPSTQSNVFTLGVLFLQVITKRPPQPRTKDSSYSEREHDFAEVSRHHPLVPLIQQCLQNKEINRPLMTHVCGELAQLIEQKDSPQRMAYKLLYTAEHKSLAAALTSGKQQQLQHLLCENMPAPMFWGYAVVNNETEVYVTGGNSHSGMAIENVYRFNILLNQWDKLPSTGLHHSVPIILKNELTLVGGRIPGNKIVVSTVVTYDDGWKSKYPDMIQPRYRPAVVTYGDHVIVLGGRIKDRSTSTDSIEVMNVEERRWIKLATRLPSKIYDIQATVSRDCVWIVGYDDGYKRSNKVLSIPVKDLISDPTLKHSFKTIRHDTLYYKMSLVPNSDPLVVLGGDNWRNKPTSAVVVFDYKTESWSEVASLSSPRAYCAVATVGQCGLLVIGGCSETKSEKASNSTCLQTVELYYI